MDLTALLWLQALQSRVFGNRNPFWQVLRSVWYAATDIPLMFAARKQLAQALIEEQQKQQAYGADVPAHNWVKQV
jgi:hypothetical protein